MATSHESIDQISDAKPPAAEEGWDSGPLVIWVATSSTDDTPKTINLADTIGQNANPPLETRRNDYNCYFLPSFLSQNNEQFRREKIVPMFVEACKKASFKVTGRYQGKANTIVFQCMRGRFNVRNAERKRHRKSDRALKISGQKHGETTCKFRFNVYWAREMDRWFIPFRQRGSIRHCGHMPIQSCLGCNGAETASAKGGSDGAVQESEGSTYMIPSQMINNEADDDNASSNNISQGKESQFYFRHLFNDICKLADSRGDDGRRTLFNGLNDIRSKLLQGPEDIPDGSESEMSNRPDANECVDTRKRKSDSPSSEEGGRMDPPMIGNYGYLGDGTF